MNLQEFKQTIIDVPDFPKPGIIFKDITPSLNNPKAFSFLINELCKQVPESCTNIVGIESRGFILASAMALKLNLPLVLIRKPGKLPRKVYSYKYELEYGEDELQLHQEDITKESRVVIVDDVLATGGTANATEILCQTAGSTVLTHLFVMEIEALQGSAKLSNKHWALMQV